MERFVGRSKKLVALLDCFAALAMTLNIHLLFVIAKKSVEPCALRCFEAIFITINNN
jgi:hypothetical protein